jgi:arylsulfatase A-like enzyme
MSTNQKGAGASAPERTGLVRRDLLLKGGSLLALSGAAGTATAQTQQTTPATPSSSPTAKPNILVIWGDDIGTWNISHNNRGMMGYSTPNIDRIAKEGVSFTDYYGQQSCTAGRAAFLGGNVPVRTGMTKVGLPGAKEGWQKTDVTVATVMKGLGYATGQFGKNHQGDRDEHLPTVHGFDEFLGNLYHLNAEEEPENRDYPKDPEFRKKFGPRGVIHAWANPDGTQKVEDTGPLTRKRMETIDDETVAAAKDFIQRQHREGKPWFVWWNGTRMHFRTHVKPQHRGIAGPNGDEYQDGMVEHDMHVGELLKLLDDLGVANNTLVFYSTDNGPHYNTWPDAGITMFRSEKNSNWEGAYRVPAFARWPGKFPAGVTLNGIVAHEDWLPTFAAAGGDPGIKEKLLAGVGLNGRT